MQCGGTLEQFELLTLRDCLDFIITYVNIIINRINHINLQSPFLMVEQMIMTNMTSSLFATLFLSINTKKGCDKL